MKRAYLSLCLCGLAATAASHVQADVLSFTATENLFVQNGSVAHAGDTNFNAVIRVEGGSRVRTGYLQFDLSTLPASAINSAKLVIQHAVDAGTGPVGVFAIENNAWSEAQFLDPGFDFANLPTIGAELGESGTGINGNAVFEIDVSSYVTGAGTYSLALNSKGADGDDFAFASTRYEAFRQAQILLGNDPPEAAGPQLVVDIVPEPATAMLAMLGLGAAASRRRR